MSPLSRREFLAAGAAAGAGLVIGFYLPHGSSSSTTFSPNAFLKIAPDGKITIVVARSEMGQGVHTSLPMILAEELEADWRQITVEQAGANPTLYGDQQTGSSASLRISWDPLRKAGSVGARDADKRRGTRMGRTAIRVRGRKQLRRARNFQPSIELWAIGGKSRKASYSGRASVKRREGLQTSRQTSPSSRWSVKGRWKCNLRN